MQNLFRKYGQYFYLLLAIVGGGLTFYYAIAGSIAHNGNFNISEFIGSTWIDNLYAKSITLDFWTGAVAGTFFMLVEGLRLKIKRLWLYILLTFLIAFAFAFPFFLFIRHNSINKKNRY
jgi:Terpene cyclase DEP1